MDWVRRFVLPATVVQLASSASQAPTRSFQDTGLRRSSLEKDNDASKPPLALADQSTTVAKVSSEQGGVKVGDKSTGAAVAAIAARDATQVEEDHGQEQKSESHDVNESPPSMEKAMADPGVTTVEPKLASTPPKDVTVMSKDDSVSEVTADPVNNPNQFQSDSESQRPEQVPEFPETPDSESKRTSTVAAGSEEETEKSQAPINDENTPLKDLFFRPKMEEAKSASASKDDDVDPPPKASLHKSSGFIKKEGNDKLPYDRAYLMALRECASSQTKPKGLPNLEIILDRPVSRAVGDTSSDFTPIFFQPGTPKRPVSRAVGDTSPDYIPIFFQPGTPKRVKNLEAKAVSILNRLTPMNFEPLSSEMMALRIGNYDQLQQLVTIFFDKVTLETKFVEAYAKLCKKMCRLKVPPPPGVKENQATFRVLLLTKCQTEFESDKTIVFEDPEEKRKKLEAELPEGPDKKDQIETVLYHMKLRRLKFYGNIRFIGELFKLSMVTENIMHDCIFRLLKARDDESLLSVCQLITTVGSILDTEKAKLRMDQYFATMVEFAEERKSRIKLTVKGVIELRQNNWVPRKEQTGPKKIDEVRQDFHQEQQIKQSLQNQPLPPRNDPQPRSRHGSKQRQEEKPNDDGWNTVGSKSIRIDASKMKFSKEKDYDASKPPLEVADRSTTVAKVFSEQGGVKVKDKSTAAAVAALAAWDATQVEEDHGQEKQSESHDVNESPPSMEKAMADPGVTTVEPKLESTPPKDVTVGSKDDSLSEVTAAPVNNQNQLQSDRESQRQEQAPEFPETPDSESNTTSTVAAGSEEGTERSQAPINDENTPLKDLFFRPEMEKAKTASASKDDDVDPPPKASLHKSSGFIKKEGNDKLQYDGAYLMTLRECASSQTKPKGLPNLEIILDRVRNSHKCLSIEMVGHFSIVYIF
ncbi:eukaryotic translation initiation factor 4 gamma 1 [Plakobranchus ocellatus]|uniref:Eukaryotic translation initiation factor 4 gamma 1 n=1 Tax=Plakobranchus ocellatus TaxID=259542 RepID=A0AAV4AJZ8_9GAST|nr:eukaryotic translation initiation factor 4 gamma 1 [Plakobranchus ocellatus]